ncbi:PAS domain-containing protein, partial [Arcobacteraceae bacterium]|nr:PAS domain-containing protein [Arcobacteraceae bacterium]
EDLIGKDGYDFFPKKNVNKCSKDEKKALSSDDPIEFEDKIIYEDTIKYFKTKKQKIYDKSGIIIGVLSIFRDITETKQYQLLYEDNNELLEYINQETNTRKILNKIVELSERRNPNLKCSILLLDQDKLHLNNGIAPSLPQFYSQAVNGLKIGKNVGSCGAAAFMKKRIIVEDINTHENWSPFLQLTKKADLHSCWSEPIFSSNNEILGTFAMYSNKPSKPSGFELKLISSYAHLAALTIEKENKKIEADIQKRKELQKQLTKKTEDLQLFKQVVENISYGVTITKASDNHELLYINKSFENMTGYSKEELIGRNCKFLQNDDTKQKPIQDLRDAIKNKVKIQVELRNYKKDGTLFYNLISIAPVYDKNDKITHFVGIQKDITQAKKQDAIITEQSKLASMGEMIGNIAHQWRQPLSVISTAATGMQLQKQFHLLKDEEFNKTCESINANVQYLSQTIDDFKNYIQKDSIQTYFKLSKSIKKFVSLVSGTVKNNDINLILNLDDSIELNGFENELVQCYMNIFNNAKDALYQTEEKLIIINSYIENNMVNISIKDNAGGIQKDIISKVFEPYFTTKYKYQGTGLGLHMTYNLIVDGMEGSIEVNNTNFIYENKEFIGAEFIITLLIT